MGSQIKKKSNIGKYGISAGISTLKISDDEDVSFLLIIETKKSGKEEIKPTGAYRILESCHILGQGVRGFSELMSGKSQGASC